LTVAFLMSDPPRFNPTDVVAFAEKMRQRTTLIFFCHFSEPYHSQHQHGAGGVWKNDPRAFLTEDQIVYVL
jgi:hypothetical protein